jgi:hypothetical protein
MPEKSSATKHSKRSEELERAKSEKMQADIQELTNTLDNFKNSHVLENRKLYSSLSDMSNDIGAIMSMLRSTSERQDSQERLMHERALTQEQKLYEHTQAMYDLINEKLAPTPEKNVRRSRGSDIPVDDSTYEESVDSQSELRRAEVEQVIEEAMSTRRDVSRNASERDEAVHLFQLGCTEDDYDSRMDFIIVNQENMKRDIEGIAESTNPRIGKPENRKRKQAILLMNETKI